MKTIITTNQPKKLLLRGMLCFYFNTDKEADKFFNRVDNLANGERFSPAPLLFKAATHRHSRVMPMRATADNI